MSTEYRAIRLNGYRVKTSDVSEEDLDELTYRCSYYPRGDYTYIGSAEEAADDQVKAIDNVPPFKPSKAFMDIIAKYPQADICKGTFLFVWSFCWI